MLSSFEPLSIRRKAASLAVKVTCTFTTFRWPHDFFILNGYNERYPSHVGAKKTRQTGAKRPIGSKESNTASMSFVRRSTFDKRASWFHRPPT